MTDTQGNIAAEEIQPAPIPSETKPAETVVTPLPDEASERTRVEFEKLTKHNAELKEQLDAYKGKTSVLDDLKPPAPVIETKVEPKSRFVDENGYVDVAKVEESLSKADERAAKAEAKAEEVARKIQDSEEKAMVKAAHAEFPQLDPHNENFDPKFYELVRNDLIGQMMQGTQDIVQAAQRVSKLYTPVDVEAAKTEAVTEYKGKVKRSQATESVTGRGKGEPSDQEELARKTREGDPNALFKRLQASGN